MLQPTIGDRVIERALAEKEEAKSVLAAFAKDESVVKRVEAAICEFDSRPPHTFGSSKAQAIRLALVEVLSEAATGS